MYTFSVDELIEAHTGRSTQETAKILGCSVGIVYARCKKYNLFYLRFQYRQAKQRERLEECLKGTTLKEAGEGLGISKQAVKSLINTYEIDREKFPHSVSSKIRLDPVLNGLELNIRDLNKLGFQLHLNSGSNMFPGRSFRSRCLNKTIKALSRDGWSIKDITETCRTSRSNVSRIRRGY